MSRDGTELHGKLIVANLHDLTMAPIYMAPTGENGAVVARLDPGGPPPSQIHGRFSGVLAEGTITAADLVGPLAGGTLEHLADAMRTGNTYVNVHTVANPGGDIRRQIEVQRP